MTTPTRTLEIVRHAKSSWSDSSLADLDRPLSGRGRQAALDLARHLATVAPRPDHALCSPATRARQTLAAIEDAVGPGLAVEISQSLYPGDAMRLIVALRELPAAASVAVLIGHCPAVQELALALADDRTSAELALMREKFPTGALATFSVPAPWRSLAPACGSLTGFWTPRSRAGSDGRPTETESVASSRRADPTGRACSC